MGHLASIHTLSIYLLHNLENAWLEFKHNTLSLHIENKILMATSGKKKLATYDVKMFFNYILIQYFNSINTTIFLTLFHYTIINYY